MRESASRNKIGISRRLTAKLTSQKLYNPRDLVRPHRLDIAAKTVFARAYIEGNTSQWPEELYREHIKAWNGFFEQQPSKQSFEDFKKSFTEVIEASLRGDFQYHKSPVALDIDSKLENGAHRVSTALVLDKFVNTYISTDMKAGEWDHNFFKYWANEGQSKGLAEKYIDAMTIEYVSLVPTQMYAVILFPAASGHREKADDVIKQMGEVLNVKEIPHSELEGRQVIRQLYMGEWWNSDANVDHVNNKAAQCFKGDEPLRVYIVRSSLNEKERRAIKEKLRAVWKIDNHSIHMSDTEDEVFRIATMFFNHNSRKILSVKKNREYLPIFGKLFHEYAESMPSDFIERERFCIDSSGTLGVLGIRDVNDIDYLHRGDDMIKSDNPGVASHNEHAHWYDISIDEIVTNPENHFYYNGVKFASLDVVMRMKQRRNESKDKKDVKLIRDFIKKYGE